MFRVTNPMMNATLLRNISAGASRVNTYQSQTETSFKINRLSDDPLGMIVALESRSKVYAMERYVKNLDDADSWLTMVESSLMEMNNIVTTVYTDLIDASTDGKTADDRKAIAEKIAQFRDQLINAANKTITDKYLFGGYNATVAPFEVKDGVLYYNGYNMYSSEFTELNQEQFILDAKDTIHNIIMGNNAAYVNPSDVIPDMKSALGAMEQMVAAAQSVYNNRLVEDKANPGSSIAPPAQYMIDAMQTVLDATGWAASDPDKAAAAQAVIDTAQAAQDKSIAETGLSIDTDLLMKNLNAMVSNTKNTVDDLTKKINRNEFADIGEVTDYFRDTVVAEAQADADMAVKAQADALAGFGLAFEGDKKYEIEIGFGQLMNISLNGVELFGTGENNIFKILDELYTALTRDFVDTEYGHDSYVNDAIGFLDAQYGAASTVTTEPEYQLKVQEATDAMMAVAAAGSAVEGSRTQDILEAMRDMASSSGFSADQIAAAEMLISKVEKGINAGMSMADLKNNLQQTSVALTKLNNDVQKDPLTSILLDLEAITSTAATGGSPNAYTAETAGFLDAQYAGATADADEYRQKTHDAIAAMKAVAEAGAAVTSGNAADIVTAMNAAMSGGWTVEQTAAAQSLINQVNIDAGVLLASDIITSLSETISDITALDASIQGASTPRNLADLQTVTADAKKSAQVSLLTSQAGLRTGSRADDVTPFISKLQGKQKEMMGLLAIIGGRTNRIEIVQERYSLDDLNYTERISRIEDADLAEVITKLKMAQAVYEAALQAGANVIQPTLMNFLR